MNVEVRVKTKKTYERIIERGFDLWDLMVIGYRELTRKEKSVAERIPIREWAVKNSVDLSRQRLSVLCRSGRIPSAEKIDGEWYVNENAVIN